MVAGCASASHLSFQCVSRCAALGQRVSTPHVLAHEFARPVQPALDRTGLFAQPMRDLGDGQLLEIAQQHHLKLVGWQRFEGIGEIDPQRTVRLREHQLLGHLVGQ